MKWRDTGTIFLDEIGELPLPMQAKLLRVLETGEIQKIAHKGQLHSDFRLIGATNRNLAEMVRQGQFREDLYHRLSVFELDIPPLRDRVSDIPLLVRHFVTQSVGDNRQKDIRIDDALYDAFAQYPWRGNVRELKNVLVYALYSLGDDQSVLTVQHLPPRFMRELEAAAVAGTIPDAEGSRQDSQNFSESQRPGRTQGIVGRAGQFPLQQGAGRPDSGDFPEQAVPQAPGTWPARQV